MNFNLQAHIDEDAFEKLELVYAGGEMPDANEFLRGAIRWSEDQINHLAWLRYHAAVSGAMRWPWSQEARISVRLPIWE